MSEATAGFAEGAPGLSEYDKRVLAEADAKRLAEALGEQMLEFDGEPHAFACAKAHKLERECDTRCHNAREALSAHREQVAGHG